MDLYCPRCGEPWDHDSLHDEAQARYGFAYNAPGYNGDEYKAVFGQVSKEFRAQGCSALRAAFGVSSCEPVPSDRAAVARVAYDILGDDLDGAAAMLDDYMGGF